MQHIEVEQLLRAQFIARTGQKRKIRLPASAGLEVSGTREHMTIWASRSAVMQNMQTPPAAIEAWALALMTWCDVRHVTLDWDHPDEAEARDPHVQRFLYRVLRFEELLEATVSVKDRHRLDALRFTQKDVTPTINAASDQDTAEVSVNKPEAELERVFARQTSAARRRLMAHLGLAKLGRQFPVGVFDGKPRRAAAIFTGGTSAIDLVGTGLDRSLWLLELKVATNIPLGAISELFFYTMIMHDLSRGCIAFTDKLAGERVALTPEDVRGASCINARLFAERFHPLICEALFTPLNMGARRLGWPVHFGTLHAQPFVGGHD